MHRKKWISLFLSGSILGILFWLVDWGDLFTILAQTDVALLTVAGFAFMLAYVPATVRWKLLQRGVGLDISFVSAFEIIVISYGLNRLLPANAGDLARSKVSERYFEVESHSTQLGLVALERVLDVASILVLFWSMSYFASGLIPSTPVQMSCVLGVGLLAVIALFRSTVWNSLLSWLPEDIRQTLQNVTAGYAALSLHVLLWTLFLSFLRWLLAAAIVYVIFAAIGVEGRFTLAITVMMAMALTALLPITPGGIGPVDAVGTGLLTIAGFPYESALAVVLLQRSFGLILTSLTGIAVYNIRTMLGSRRTD